MDILRNYAAFEYRRTEEDRFIESLDLHVYSAVHETGQEEFKPACEHLNASRLFNLLQEKRETREKAGTAKASLELIFLPATEKKKGFGLSKNDFLKLFRDLNLDESLLGFLVSSRSGWYCVDDGHGCYSFLYKDYLYSFAWSFNSNTMETRALVSERSAYKDHSFLKKKDSDSQDFDLPGLQPIHLYHPLTLAFFVLVDVTCYLDRLIVTDGYRLGDVEKLTNHGKWARRQEELRQEELKRLAEQKKAENQEEPYQQNKHSTKQSEGDKAEVLEDVKAMRKRVNKLSTASRKIADVIGVFSTLFKTVDVAESMAMTFEEPGFWTNREEHDEQKSSAKSMRDAVKLLRARIHTVNESALSTQKRAKAQANVVSGLIAREDTRIGHQLADRARRDGSTMKVIALMTMGFLPATFFAALWDIPVLEQGIVKDEFWVYWAFTIPTTIAIFLVWDLLNDKKLQKLKNLVELENLRALCKKQKEAEEAHAGKRADDSARGSGMEIDLESGSNHF